MKWYTIDLIIIGIISLSVLTGLIRGFIKELVALCVWILAIWVAYNYSSSLDPWLQPYLQDKTMRTGCAFVILLLGTVLIGGLINALLGFILRRSGLSGTDRLLGMGFGFARGIVIVAVIMAALRMTSLPLEYSRESKLYAQFTPVVNWVYVMMPEFVKRAKEISPEKKLVDFENEATEAA